MATKSITDTLTLLSSAKMPRLGFGVYRSPRDVCVRSCQAALDAGYRHIDTAQFYANEAEVGQAVRDYQGAADRKDVFLTTKTLSSGGSAEKCYKTAVESIDKLDPGNGAGTGTGTQASYVDLFLIHSPSSGKTGRKEMWQALEKLHREGRARSIGVSNFGIGHIEELREFAEVWPPHVNQIELHPWMQQREIVDYCHKNGIAVQAYCPIARNQKADDPAVAAISGKHGVTPNQVLIRYSLQKGWVPLPKSDDPGRIRTNADVFGFELSGDDMAALDALDQGPAGALVQAVTN